MRMSAIASRLPTCRTWQTILAATGGSESTVEVWAPTTKHQLHGITRANVLRLCAAHGIHHVEKDFSLTSVYSAEEAFRDRHICGPHSGHSGVIYCEGVTQRVGVLLVSDCAHCTCSPAPCAIRTGSGRHELPCIRSTQRHHDVQIDGRSIGTGARGPVCSKLQQLYTDAMDAQADRGRLTLDGIW